MKKIIFLDVDGVLHPLNEKHLPKGVPLSALVERGENDECGFPVLEGEFIERCMYALKKIVDGSGADIVLSSTWREDKCGRDAVNEQLEKYGIKPAIGYTPMLSGCFDRRRAKEIFSWIVKHEFFGNFLILDDSDIFNEESEKLKKDKLFNLLHPHFLRCDMSIALSAHNVAHAITTLALNPSSAFKDEFSAIIDEAEH